MEFLERKINKEFGGDFHQQKINAIKCKKIIDFLKISM
jgi:hypothetical protein